MNERELKEHEAAGIEWCSVIDPPWIEMPPVRVGTVPSGRGTPDQYILLTDDNRPLMRVDAYASSEESYSSKDATMWRGLLLIGWGHCIYLINIVSRAVTRYPLGAYFGHMCAADDYLLIASAERLFRISTDGSLTWRTEPLGIDGVLIDSVENGVIRCQGEWNPPGGWKHFQIRLDSGQLV